MKIDETGHQNIDEIRRRLNWHCILDEYECFLLALLQDRYLTVFYLEPLFLIISQVVAIDGPLRLDLMNSTHLFPNLSSNLHIEQVNLPIKWLCLLQILHPLPWIQPIKLLGIWFGCLQYHQYIVYYFSVPRFNELWHSMYQVYQCKFYAFSLGYTEHLAFPNVDILILQEFVTYLDPIVILHNLFLFVLSYVTNTTVEFSKKNVGHRLKVLHQH